MLEDDSHITSKARNSLDLFVGNKMSRPDVDTNTNDIDMEETSMNIELDSVCDTALLKDEESLKLSGFEEDKSKKINLFEPSASEEGRNARSIVTVATLKTRQQAEIFIQDQLYLLLQHDRKAMLPAQLQQTLSSILKNCPDLGKGHFLSYLNFLRVREHIGAVHSLIRAYDSKLMHKELNRGGEDITRTFRYSALNMAALQAQFGHKELGLVSLEEAIKLAQECNDQILLQYALAWLYCLSDSQTRLLEPLSQTNHSRLYLEGGLGGQSALWSVQAGLWSIWGNIHLTAVCSQLVLHMTSQLTTSLFAPSNASPTCAALCNLAIILANLGEFSLSSEVLHHTQNQFPSPWEYSRLWMFAQCYITFYESLHQGLWSQAKAFVINMAAINPTYSKILEIELLIAKGAFSQALILTTDLRNNDLQLMEEKNGQGIDPEISVKALLLEAEAQAGGNNLGAALETVVNAILLAEEYSMAYLIALGRLHLSCIQLHLGIVRESKISLENGLDVILAGGAIYDQGRAKLLQAKIEVCSAVQSNSENLTKAATMLEEAQKFFATVKAYQREKEVVYLKARVYHSCGKMAERNHSALEFRQLEQRHPSQPLVVNSCVF
ncbi:Anaphase-promoting complex subunit 5 [Armadillidium nasatum]|uniref:Anaphase-promoting complex subunit 5 n=1 Tax=Armadillidium nasatum TaxID=96803 RepID=A0A5N5SLW4_9CRUS|nr:Anaphase-promoting complex subunit 5 [Armadillidium nasatum]